MIISYLGHACFRFKGKNATVVTDPYDEEVFGKAMPLVQADIVTISHEHHDHNHLERIAGEPFVIRGPGQYEIKAVEISGIPAFHDRQKGQERGKNTIYLYRFDELKLCHLGDLGAKLDDQQLEALDGVDVLMVPVGGKYSLGPREALEVVEQLEPSIVIPMHFGAQDLKWELEPVQKFLEQIDQKDLEPVDKLTVTLATLPEEREIVWLKK